MEEEHGWSRGARGVGTGKGKDGAKREDNREEYMRRKMMGDRKDEDGVKEKGRMEEDGVV